MWERKKGRKKTEEAKEGEGEEGGPIPLVSDQLPASSSFYHERGRGREEAAARQRDDRRGTGMICA